MFPQAVLFLFLASAVLGPLSPEALRQEAYYGLAGETVRAIEPNSEADPAALLASHDGPLKV